MTEASGTSAQTTEIRDGFQFDQAALARWMREHVPGFHGPITARQFRGGQSNPTFSVTTEAAAYVLRRKPPGQLLAGAHAIEREARVMTSLRSTGFPVPHVHGLCEDAAVIGSPFYVMDMVEGRIFWDAALPELAPNERAACYDAMNAVIAQLHRVEAEAAGLADYGRPGNYFERQISRWSRQYVGDEMAGRDAAMDAVIVWLRGHIPAGDECAIVHGDYRIDNLIFHPIEPRILAVLDWELSTLGHPLADFAYHAMSYHMPPHIVAGLGGCDPRALGIPTEEEYIAAYCARTGRVGIPDFGFYLTFNFFRLAAIFHGIKGRVIRGTAASSEAHERAKAFPELAALALAQTR